jgi:hypothetical protein
MAHKGRPYEFQFERDLSRFLGINTCCPKRWNMRNFEATGTKAHHWDNFTVPIPSDEGSAEYNDPGSIEWTFPPPPLAAGDTFCVLRYALTHDADMFQGRLSFHDGSGELGYCEFHRPHINENYIPVVPASFEPWHLVNPTLFSGLFGGYLIYRDYAGTS